MKTTVISPYRSTDYNMSPVELSGDLTKPYVFHLMDMKTMRYFRFMSAVAVLIWAAFSCSDIAHAQTDDIFVPEITQDSLPNGMQLYFIRVNDIPLVEISVVVDAGLSCQRKYEKGLAQITNKMLLKGTSERTVGMIEQYSAMMSTELRTYTHYDYSQIHARSISRNFRGTVELLADLCRNADFPNRYLELMRRDLAALYETYDMKAGERASVELLRRLCGEDHPLTKSLVLELGGIESISSTDLQEFYSRFYRPERTSIIVAGNIDPKFAFTIINEKFAGWKGADPQNRVPEDAPQSAMSSEKLVLVMDSTARLAAYRFGFPGLQRNSPDFHELVVLNQLLGGNGSSLLRQELWEKRMLAPSFTSSIGYAKDRGYLVISGNAPLAMIDSIRVFVRAALDSLRSGGFSDQDLIDARNTLLVGTPYEYSSNSAMNRHAKEIIVYGLPIDEFQHYEERIIGVSRTGIQDLANELLGSESQVTVIATDNTHLDTMPQLSGENGWSIIEQ